MPTTTDHALSNHTDRPIEPVADRLNRHVDGASPTTSLRRTTGKWVVVAAIAAASAIAAAVLDTNDGVRTSTAAGGTAAIANAPVERTPTKLDVRGIPVWWSGHGGSARLDEATELDVRGIPIWWSGHGGSARLDEATELDVRGIPIWWSGASPARTSSLRPQK